MFESQSYGHGDISVLQLFSSGIFCRSSPQFDDLFGFSVEDVLNEVKRGRKLVTFCDIFTNKSAQLILLKYSCHCFNQYVCIRCVPNVRKMVPRLGVKSNAVRSPTTTLVLSKKEPLQLRMQTREIFG